MPFFLPGRWFDVLQKVSSQLKTNLTSVTKNRADKVTGSCSQVAVWKQLQLKTHSGVLSFLRRMLFIITFAYSSLLL